MRTHGKVIATGFALLYFSVPLRALGGGVVGTGTPASCTEAALDVALADGGKVTFNCGLIPLTIFVTIQKSIAMDTNIDGGNLITLDGNGKTPILFVNSGVSLALANLTISNGYGAGSGNNAGGIYNFNGVLNVSNSTFSNNESSGATFGAGGGAIYNDGGTLTVTDTTFSGNSAIGPFDGKGGGVYNAGTATLINCTFTGNSAASVSVTGGTSGGGGLYNDSGATARLTNCKFNDNMAGQGGGLYNFGQVTLTSCTFGGNSAASGSGGGVSNGGTATLTNCTLSGNSAPSVAYGAGGGGLFNGGTVTLIDCTLSANSVGEGFGGGIGVDPILRQISGSDKLMPCGSKCVCCT